jgi:C4-dicarboxylate-specific signal transduction histidine kinase
MVATLWVLAGLGGFLAYFLTSDPSKLDKPPALIGIYVACAVVLDLFVGSSRRVTLQRISPVVVLALLVTPGVPPTIALMADFMATLVLVISSQLSTSTIAQAGRSLMPGIATALFLGSRATLDQNAYFFAAEVFLLVSLFTRSTDPPFRNDVFLVVSFPAVALMLRSLAELSLAYVLLTLPLLFLLTTVDTEMLLRYFQLQKQLDTTKTQVIATHRARQESERESRRKGVLLERREKQLELLNGLGRQLDDAKASEDLGRFLVLECHRLIGAEVALVVLVDTASNTVSRVICDLPAQTLGLKAGDPVPALIRSGFTGRAPWSAPVWENKKSFLTVSLGNEGWLYLAHTEAEAFPDFLEGFFSAVGRHAGSAALAIRRLTEVRELARREAQEKELVAQEKEKVAEQNQNLRSLIASFDSLTEASLSSDSELLRQGTETIQRLTGADQVIFRAPELERGPNQYGALAFEDREWPSFLYLRGTGPSGNVLCLSASPGCFSQGHLEWCTLLRDFLNKTLENGLLHRRITSSLAKLKDTQQEVVRSSQWAAAGRLAANAAHELNTPLGAIRLAAEQVRFFQGEDTPEPAKQGLASIIRSVDRCREVTDRLLITSRPVDHGELPTRPADLLLLPVLRDAVASVQPYLRASMIKLASHRLTGEHKVYVVVQDLYWAVVNVLKNAVDAVNEGERPEKRIAISVELAGDMVNIGIADNGPGIPPELRGKLFEPFFTTKKIGSGNGLGLALSRQNLGKWGGEVRLGEEPMGGGASFVISIPLSGSPAARRADLGASGMTGTPAAP